jgi:hypothetical protein
MHNAAVATEDLLVDSAVLNQAAALFALLTRFGFLSASVFALITVNMSIWNWTWSPASITQAILRLPSVALAMQTGPSTFDRIFQPRFDVPTIAEGIGKKNVNVFKTRATPKIVAEAQTSQKQDKRSSHRHQVSMSVDRDMHACSAAHFLLISATPSWK